MIIIVLFIILCILLMIYYPKKIDNINDYIIDSNDIINEYNLIIKEMSILQADLIEIPYMNIETYKKISEIIHQSNVTSNNFMKKVEELKNNLDKNKIKKYRQQTEELICLIDKLKDDLNELYKIKPIVENQYDEYQKTKKENEKKEEKDKNRLIEYKYFDGCNNKEEINKRYKALAKVYHPDSITGNEKIFKIICEEYEKIIKKK